MPKGFAAMTPEKRREIARQGGKAAHRQGKAHKWTGEEARAAARKGGQKTSQNVEHMREIGRKGGQVTGAQMEKAPKRKDDVKEEGGGIMEALADGLKRA